MGASPPCYLTKVRPLSESSVSLSRGGGLFNAE